MKLTISMMTCPSRQESAGRLESALMRQSIPNARYVGRSLDPGRRDLWGNWKLAWALRAPDATHHAIIQDDIVPCIDLPASLLAVASARPDSPISGFIPRRSVDRAREQGLSWVSTRSFLWAQCVIFPVTLGESMIRWIDENEANYSDWGIYDDTRIRQFLRFHRIPMFITVPNLVEHIGDEIGSALGHNFKASGRRARYWVGEQNSGLEFNWTDLRAVKE